MAVSRCRYLWCPKCNAVYLKEEHLKGWKIALMSPNATHTVMGTRTCSCGNVMQVQDIYNGVYDLPREYWNQVAPPHEI